MERPEAAALHHELNARAARIREANAAKADDVAFVLESLAALTADAVQDTDEELEPEAPAPPLTPIANDPPSDPLPAATDASAAAAGEAGGGLLDRAKAAIGL